LTSVGKEIVSTLLRTSLIKSFTSTPLSKVIVTLDTHNEEDDAMESIPSRSFISSSIFVVITSSMSTGFAHGYTVVTLTIPNLMSGADSFGIVKAVYDPYNITNTINKNDTL
jgi:hypothetical protein